MDGVASSSADVALLQGGAAAALHDEPGHLPPSALHRGGPSPCQSTAASPDSASPVVRSPGRQSEAPSEAPDSNSYRADAPALGSGKRSATTGAARAALPLLSPAESNGTTGPLTPEGSCLKRPRANMGGSAVQTEADGLEAEATWDPARALASARHEFGEHGGVNMSVENSTTFTVMQSEQMARIFKGEVGPEEDAFVYSRHFNPTVMHLGRQLAALEGTESGYCTASGMAAISAALMHLTCHGENIVASHRLYGGTYALLSHFLPRKCGVTTTFVDIQDLAQVDAALSASPGTRVLFFESVSNPTLVVADVDSLAQLAHRHGVTVVVDNTFAPVLLSPARRGADVVVHSISKFISGGSDLIAGCVCGPSKMIQGMMDLMEGPLMILGATMNPQVAFQISTRLPHLPLRMREHGERALATAVALQQAGLNVVYPGLSSHPQQQLLERMLNPGYGYGGMLCVDLGSSERANAFMDHLQNCSAFGYMAVSLGYHDTLMSCSGSSTSSEMGREQLEAAGISPGLVRISVGFSGVLPQRLQQLLATLRALGYGDGKQP